VNRAKAFLASRRVVPFAMRPGMPLALALCWLVGCAGVPQVAPDAELRKQLATGIDRCNANQERLAGQVKAQLGLLESQNAQLSELAAAAQAPVASQASSPENDCPKLPAAAEKQWVGQLEKVWMPSLNLALNARIDTGAETASLDARNIELFERNGKRWVRFEIEHPQKGEPAIPLERKLSRMVSIVQSNSSESERRPVIRLGITIGSVNQTAEFTLSNRSHLDYQVLVGRNILKDVMVVDVSREHIAPFVRAEAGVASAEAR